MGDSQDKSWKTPNEIIRLQRLKQKQKALQARLEKPSTTVRSNVKQFPIASEKRKNPFLDERAGNANAKKSRPSLPDTVEYSEDSVFNLLVNGNETPTTTPKAPLISKELNTFTNLINQTEDLDSEPEDDNEEEKPTNHVPIDWSLKTKIRLLSKVPVLSSRLKSSEEASGITGFVRCADLKSSETGLDISLGARFHQSTMYWQHPHLPWLTLFPRMSKLNIGVNIGDEEQKALAKDWSDSFRALFQLVRSLQCPYFYVCANSFTVLFRAAGIGGRVETHALLTPTSRGLRNALKEDDIEFSMPLKRSTNDAQNKSLDSGNETQSNSFSNSSEETAAETSIDDANTSGNGDDGVTTNGNDSEDEDAEQWLASMGVEASEIKKIRTTHARRVHNEECAEDLTDQSILLIEGIECQAFFNFLLNAKSTTTKVGRLAGVPPTLIAPVAFPGATLRNNQVKSTIVRELGIDYHSIELKGVILPHVMQYLCKLMNEAQDQYSVTTTSFTTTNAFSKAAQKLIDDLNKENKEVTAETVFGRENLSDCGLPSYILEAMCRVTPDATRSLERMYFDKKSGGYIWSEKK